MLSSKIAAEELGHMTHKGVRRPHLRAWAGGEDVQYRLRWRPLGTLAWSENGVVPTPAGRRLGADRSGRMPTSVADARRLSLGVAASDAGDQRRRGSGSAPVLAAAGGAVREAGVAGPAKARKSRQQRSPGNGPNDASRHEGHGSNPEERQNRTSSDATGAMLESEDTRSCLMLRPTSGSNCPKRRRCLCMPIVLGGSEASRAGHRVGLYSIVEGGRS